MPDGELQHTKLEGINDYIEAVDTVIGLAQRTIRIFGHSLDGGGFNSVKRHDTLQRFLLASRNNRLQIVLHDVNYVMLDCPRLMSLLRLYGHAIAIHQTQPHAQGVYDPFVVADDQHYVRRFHYADSRGLLAVNDPQGAETLIHRFGELWEASFAAVWATTTGL
ncbi:MAG: hypothetical protein HYU77_01080 [Betaproteobacteria bacterium]|nr:hypothetical protein [Betaproteobacteria bacterium]